MSPSSSCWSGVFITLSYRFIQRRCDTLMGSASFLTWYLAPDAWVRWKAVFREHRAYQGIPWNIFVSVASFNIIKANRTSCFKIFDKLNIYWSFEWCLSSFKTYFSLLVNAKWVFSTAYVWGASPCLNLDSNVLIQTVRGTNRWMDESVSVPVCLFALEMENKLR